jgi:hypothetical protein
VNTADATGLPSVRAGADGERGAGVLAALFGLAFFLGFLLLATSLVFGLLASTSLKDETERSAERVASGAAQTAGSGPACAREVARLDAWIVRHGTGGSASCRSGPDWVDVSASLVRGRSTLPAFDHVLGLDVLSAHSRARVERVR